MSPKKPKDPTFNRVRVLRMERDLSRARLAELLEVNPQTVGALERGDHSPSLNLALRVCEAFGLSVEAVFSRTGFLPMADGIHRPSQETKLRQGEPATGGSPKFERWRRPDTDHLLLLRARPGGRVPGDHLRRQVHAHALPDRGHPVGGRLRPGLQPFRHGR